MASHLNQFISYEVKHHCNPAARQHARRSTADACASGISEHWITGAAAKYGRAPTERPYR